MFVRHGIRQMRRTWRKTLLLLLLTALLTVLLATSLGMSHALRRTLQRCREDYVTVGVAEYIGPEYPTLKTVDAPLPNAACPPLSRGRFSKMSDFCDFRIDRTSFIVYYNLIDSSCFFHWCFRDLMRWRIVPVWNPRRL